MTVMWSSDLAAADRVAGRMFDADAGAMDEAYVPCKSSHAVILHSHRDVPEASEPRTSVDFEKPMIRGKVQCNRAHPC
jgi:hypothetical protein